MRTPTAYIISVRRTCACTYACIRHCGSSTLPVLRGQRHDIPSLLFQHRAQLLPTFAAYRTDSVALLRICLPGGPARRYWHVRLRCLPAHLPTNRELLVRLPL